MEGAPGMDSGIAATAATESPTMDELSTHIERFERWLNMLEAHLGPVLLGVEGPNVPSDKVAPVPATRLEDRVRELSLLLNRADDIRSRIRL